MKPYLARSKTVDENGVLIAREQYMYEHIGGMLWRARCVLNRHKKAIDPETYENICDIVFKTIIYHDLGKLCEMAQLVLSGRLKAKMPNHTDPGTAVLWKKKNRTSAMICRSHHHRLCDWVPLNFRDNQFVRERCPHINYNGTVKEYFDEMLDDLERRLDESLNDELKEEKEEFFKVNGQSRPHPAIVRFALSIVVDADHYDAADWKKNPIPLDPPPLKALDRLSLLDAYAASLRDNSERSQIRTAVYEACRHSSITNPFTYCSAEVGTGKTMATIAYALKGDPSGGILYVAPFTCLDQQTSESWRKAICFDNENPAAIVGEDNCQVDYQEQLNWGKNCYKPGDKEYDFDNLGWADLKTMVKLWDAPIVCTTGVQFIQTILGARTGKLKKYHNLTGRHIIIDESHLIPYKFWPVLLYNFKLLAEKFGCKFSFVSGSMFKPWEVAKYAEASGFDHKVDALLPPELAALTLEKEKERVKVKYEPTEFNLKRFCDYVRSGDFEGCRIIVCNTIRNAAVIAYCLKKLGEKVLHLSTAIDPTTRSKILKLVNRYLNCDKAEEEIQLPNGKKRLLRKHLQNGKKRLFLVATSCVEAGVDFSFQRGFREVAGLPNLEQFKGRVNRNEEYDETGVVVFELKIEPPWFDDTFTANFDLTDAQNTFRLFAGLGQLGPEWCHAAIMDEIANGNQEFRLPNDSPGTGLSPEKITQKEEKCQFETIADYCRPIPADKVTVIVNKEKIKNVQDIGKHSVQIFCDKLNKLPVVPSTEYPGFWEWMGPYRRFLGWATVEKDKMKAAYQRYFP